jgi:spore coat protein H
MRFQLACLVLILCAGRALAAEAPAKAAAAQVAVESKSDREVRELFEGPIPRIQIAIPADGIQGLRDDRRKNVKATVVENGVTWSNVLVHIKGAAGSTRSVDDKPALTLTMGKFVKGQRFHGLEKFHLNNSVQDPSFMSEILCGELYRKAGIPTARGTHARVWLNGRDLGLFVLKEGYDKGWLGRNFTNASGNLYDGGFLNDIEGNVERVSGNGPDNREDLKALADAARAPLPERLQRLGPLLDLDRFTTFCVLQALTQDWDGYAMKPNNYKLYADPLSGRFNFIPHGMDQMFGDPEAPVIPTFNGLLAVQTFQIPEMRRRYQERLSRLMHDVFLVEEMTRRMDRMEPRVYALIQEFNKDEENGFKEAARDFRNKVVNRVRSVQRQLADLPKPP